MSAALSIKSLTVSVEKKSILHNINLEIGVGQIHAIMGPNGSGKSSLAYTIMGHPRYIVQTGTITCFDTDITTLSPDERAKRGLFLATQSPIEIEGIALRDFLRQAYNALHRDTSEHLTPKAFAQHLDAQLNLLNMAPTYAERPINVGFSGGEKKQAEMLQLAVLKPKIALLDEIDSGLDVDALKTVCSALKTIKKAHPNLCLVIISHNPRIFDYVKPTSVHIMQAGAITSSGGPEVIKTIEFSGFTNQ